MSVASMIRFVILVVVSAAIVMPARPARAASVRVRLTIAEVYQIDNVDDSRGGELYAIVGIGGQGYWTTGYADNQSRVFPNWQFEVVADGSGPVPIIVEIWDYDWPDSDDKCDVSPVSGKKTLNVWFDANTNRISGDVAGTGGRDVWARGRGDGDRVAMRFRVTNETPVPPARSATETQPPPPAESANRGAGDGAVQVTAEAPCGTMVVRTSNQPPTVTRLPCPQIDHLLAPAGLRAGDPVILRGAHFGDQADRISATPVDKAVLAFPAGGAQAPVRLLVRGWSDGEVQAWLPAGTPAGQYRVGIAFTADDGISRLVSNMETMNVTTGR